MSVAADPEVVRRTAGEILARPEFGDHRNLLERGIDWVGGLLSDLLGGITSGLSSGTGFLGALIQISVVVGAIVLIVFVGRFIYQALRSRRPKAPESGLVVVFGEQVDPSLLAAEAAEAEASGRWKQAAMAHYRRLLSSLLLTGVLADVAGRTTGEYRTEYRSVRAVSASEFDSATVMFERAYYGDAPIDAADCAEMRRLTGALMSAGSPAPSAIGRS